MVYQGQSILHHFFYSFWSSSMVGNISDKNNVTSFRLSWFVTYSMIICDSSMIMNGGVRIFRTSGTNSLQNCNFAKLKTKSVIFETNILRQFLWMIVWFLKMLLGCIIYPFVDLWNRGSSSIRMNERKTGHLSDIQNLLWKQWELVEQSFH